MRAGAWAAVLVALALVALASMAPAIDARRRAQRAARRAAFLAEQALAEALRADLARRGAEIQGTQAAALRWQLAALTATSRTTSSCTGRRAGCAAPSASAARRSSG